VRDMVRASWEGYREEILCGTDLVTDHVSKSSVEKYRDASMPVGICSCSPDFDGQDRMVFSCRAFHPASYRHTFSCREIIEKPGSSGEYTSTSRLQRKHLFFLRRIRI
jgi:hypothetical protein